MKVRTAEKLQDTYISHFVFRQLPKSVRVDVLRFIYRTEIIGMTLNQAVNKLGKEKDPDAAKIARKLIKAVKEYRALSPQDSPIPAKPSTKKVVVKKTAPAGKKKVAPKGAKALRRGGAVKATVTETPVVKTAKKKKIIKRGK